MSRPQAFRPAEKELLSAAGAARNESALDRVRVVLVRPRGATNVGSSARAMKNMGVSDLALVAPRLRRLNRGGVMAVHARDLLEQARIVDDLSQAVSDCTLVVGTTRRGGLYRAAAAPPDTLAPLIVEHARRGRVAVLFGPEDHGLTNDDLKHCQRLIAIDTSDEYPSLNLAQAVLLCCYELRRAVQDGVPAGTGLEPAPAGDVEFLFERLQSAFLRIGFLNPQNPDHLMFAFRRLFGRAELEGSDVRILLGLARQIEWYGRAGAVASGVDPNSLRSGGAGSPPSTTRTRLEEDDRHNGEGATARLAADGGWLKANSE